MQLLVTTIQETNLIFFFFLFKKKKLKSGKSIWRKLFDLKKLCSKIICLFEEKYLIYIFNFFNGERIRKFIWKNYNYYKIVNNKIGLIMERNKISCKWNEQPVPKKESIWRISKISKKKKVGEIFLKKKCFKIWRTSHHCFNRLTWWIFIFLKIIQKKKN